MVTIEPMLDVLFGIENVNNFVYLVRIGTSERNDLIVLRHFVEEVFSVRTEDMAFRLPGPMAEYLHNIDDQGWPFVQSLAQIRVWSDS